MAFLCSCNNRSKTDESNQPAYDISENGVREIPLYSRHIIYENKLSTVVSDVKFISLETEPVFNEADIRDIQLTDEHIFLTDIHHIRKYNKEGRFIQEIGQRGEGPKEFISIYPPIQVDYRNNLIYAVDGHRSRILRYGIEGNLVNVFSIERTGSCIALIDEHTIAIRQTMSERRFDNPCRLISFYNTDGEPVKSYQSNLYPMDCRKESFGPEASLLWKHKSNSYYLEYGADTIFCVNNSALIPKYKLTGNLKVEGEEIFLINSGRKLRNIQYPFLPYSSIFESDSFMIFRLASDYERFFAVYNKNTEEFHRTFHENPEVISVRKQDNKLMDYFIDDLVSGLRINPQYQSRGHAIALIPAVTVCERKQEILDFIDSYPTREGDSLKSVIENITEEDNALVMTVTFK
jgi:hypothetical protein